MNYKRNDEIQIGKKMAQIMMKVKAQLFLMKNEKEIVRNIDVNNHQKVF